MKKIIVAISIILSLCSCASKKLPSPELAEGLRGQQFGIDKNINEETIDKYLNRDDAIYRDVRLLVDPANYENIGGDSYLSGIVKGFEVVSYPYFVPLNGLPEAVGQGYTGPTLFSIDSNNKYVENYEESLDIVEHLFPKDKVIFLMCGGGGYAGMMKSFLIGIGYDENKIYNVGGYWYYKGVNNVQIKRIDEENNVHYDFYKLINHDIDFNYLEVKK